MILLACLIVSVLSFTRLPTWVLLALVLLPPIVATAATHDTTLLKAVGIALMGALILYAPLTLLISAIGRVAFWVCAHRFRFAYFVLTTVLAAGIFLNLVQLTV